MSIVQLVMEKKMILDDIIENALEIDHFREFPTKTQISLLFYEIEQAKKLGIPRRFICQTLNKAGCNVQPAYFSVVLSIIRKRMKTSIYQTNPLLRQIQRRNQNVYHDD
jgi:hypothetical protein